MKEKLSILLEKLYRENYLEKEELKFILDNITYETAGPLFYYASKTRKEIYQDRVFLRALVEISNYCKNNCLYCGIRKDNRHVGRYRLLPEQIINCCRSAYQQGYRTFVLQGGEDNFYTTGILAAIIREIKRNFPDMAVTLSLGERSRGDYQELFEAGADRYLLRHETISGELYQKYHPGMIQEKRLQALKTLKEIGFQAGTGFIIGLPGQDNEILVEELHFLKEFKPAMAGIGPLIPHPETPLAEAETGSVDKTLILLALIRLLLPEVLLPVTTAVNTLDRKGWEKGFEAGGNVIMPVITPASFRNKYEIYKNKGSADGSKLKEIKERIEKAGYQVDMGRGDNPLWLKAN